MTPWEQLVALAEHELGLVRGGNAEALPPAMAARDRLALSLGQAPASARPALERLAAVQEQLVVELTLARDDAARELATLQRGRGAVRGDRAAAGVTGSTFDAAF